MKTTLLLFLLGNRILIANSSLQIDILLVKFLILALVGSQLVDETLLIGLLVLQGLVSLTLSLFKLSVKLLHSVFEFITLGDFIKQRTSLFKDLTHGLRVHDGLLGQHILVPTTQLFHFQL